MMVATYW